MNDYLLTILLSQAPGEITVIDMITSAGAVSRGVLVVLLLFSLASWGIIMHKMRLYKKIRKDTDAFRDFFQKKNQLDHIYTYAKKLRNCPMARVFLAGYIELATQFRLTQGGQPDSDEGFLLEKLDSISRALERATAQEVTKLERWLFFLGTTGSVTPFIGLFGTVWGVMTAFSGIGSKGSASIAVVAPGIAEALIVTAAGLFTAIPAVIAYNYFVYRVKIKATDMDNFSLDMLSLIDRIYIKRS
ncbi:MAG: MotA/TolQ/ExbB proton channel family protein [Nitrospinae bacterium]|nr:MotA/TolQ/ExbB proton channel family protein [Nitrospinota bacterium]MBF0633974.1 MotA/TolQ/ExbB proton channel family protein [Nitrospinota bacterium]